MSAIKDREAHQPRWGGGQAQEISRSAQVGDSAVGGKGTGFGGAVASDGALSHTDGWPFCSTRSSCGDSEGGSEGGAIVMLFIGR